MPRSSLDPNAKPFEVKVGVGFAAFGGMYRLGDPSMCPPNRFRRLINVRLGDKDVVSRPGLTTEWTGPADPVIGMIEIPKKRGAAKIWLGPNWMNDGIGYTPDGSTYYNAYFIAIMTDRIVPPDYFPHESGKVLFFINEFAPDLTSLPVGQQRAQYPLGMRKLGPVSHMPWPWLFPGVTGTGLTAWATNEQRFFRGGLNQPGAISGGMTHSHTRDRELAFSTVTPPDGYWADFPDEYQWGNCLDATIFFRGDWLCVGSIVPVLWNPGVLAGKASGAAGTGQQMFRVNLSDLRIDPPSSLVAGGLHENAFFGGSLDEVFRMPGVTVSDLPTNAPRSGGGIDGETIRSMCVRSTRNDNPITASQATSEKLYLGTFGGSPLTPGAWIVQDVTYRPPIHNLTDGKVYSWDGSTLKLETSGLGPAVVVTTLPDGSVLACGRTAAKLFDATDNTWKAVTLSPTPSTLPRIVNNQVSPWTLDVPTNPDANWLPQGIIWLERVLFRGEVYLVGFDSARQGTRSGVGGFALFYSGDAGHLFPPYAYSPSADGYGLYKFTRSTLTLARVRGGADIWPLVQPTIELTVPDVDNPNPYGAGAGLYTTEFPVYLPSKSCSLAVFANVLLYAWGVTLGALNESTGLVAAGIGAFDGSTWDDDALGIAVQSDGGTQFWRDGVTDMLSTASGVWIQGYPGDRFGFYDGSSIAEKLQLDIPDENNVGRGRMFVGPA